jgi:hypothetical protein
MIETILVLLAVVIVCEAVTELVVKSEIFLPLHVFLERRKSNFLCRFAGKAISCGYCFSVWASIVLNIIIMLTGNVLIVLPFSTASITAQVLLNLLFSVILVHRLSNYLHGISDRYCDTRKDNRYSDSLEL